MASRGVNKVILVGNLGQDPEVRFMPAGGAVANFTIATSESWKDKQTGEQKERTEWHRIVMYQRLAEIAGEYLRKGAKVYVEGRLQTRKWQDQNGQERYTTEIVANEMQMLDGRGQGGGQQGGGFGGGQQMGGGSQGGFNQQGGQQGGFNQQPAAQPASGQGGFNQQPAAQPSSGQGGFNQQKPAAAPAQNQSGGFNQQPAAQPSSGQGGFNQQQRPQQGGFNQQQQPQQNNQNAGGGFNNTPSEPNIDFDDDIPF